MHYQIEFIYRANHPRPLNITFHTHNCYELVLYTQGKGEIETETHRYPYKKNQIVIVPPHTAHQESNLQSSCNLVVGFQTDAEAVPVGSFRANAVMVSILENMLQEKVRRLSYSEEILGLQIHRLMLLLMRPEAVSGRGGDFSAILEHIDKYIDENLNMPIQFSDFAEMYSYSPDRFRHIFTEHTGIAPKQYLILKRLAKSKLLLETSGMSLTEIAHECGFYDASQFSKMFKRCFAATPSSFRQQIHKKVY